MKTFVLLAVFLFAYSFADSNESKSLEEEDIKEIAEFVKDKFNSTIVFDMMRLAEKAKEKCPDIETKMENAAEEIAECVTDIELGSNTFCALIRENLKKCSKPGLDAIASCLPDESKGLPAMFGKIIGAILDQACNSTVEEILELFNPCVYTVNKDATASPECTEVKESLIRHKDKLPSKSMICSCPFPSIRLKTKLDFKNGNLEMAKHYQNEFALLEIDPQGEKLFSKARRGL